MKKHSMKKWIAIFMTACMVCMLGACGTASDNTAEGEDTLENTQSESETEETSAAESVQESNEIRDTPEEAAHTLIAYFSATGNTKPIAEYIAEALDADLYRITPAEEYTEEDLDYNNTESRTTIEQNDDTCRPELADYSLDLSGYDTVIIGHPIWWGEAPKIIYTFLENYDFSGKTITTFCTSASSGLGSSAENLKTSVSGEVTWLDSRRFSIGSEEAEVIEWLQEIGLYTE